MPEDRLDRHLRYIVWLIGIVVYAAFAYLMVVLLHRGGNYPTGSDTFAHLYKGETLYHDILKGDLYPLYDEGWYNGVQMMRYWAPLPVYVIAGMIAIAGGNLLNGYLLFVALILFFGAISVLYVSMRRHRPVLGLVLGLLWFYMPNNLYALFGEGNLPRSLSMIFLPLFFDALYGLLHDEDLSRVKYLILTFFLIVCCHTGYAGMVLLSVILYLLIYRILGGKRRLAFDALLSMILGYILLGFWLYPSLKGGISNTDSSQVMKGFFQSILISINPLYRITDSQTVFYFGLAAFLLTVFGMITARRKSKPGFITAFLILLLTTTPAYTVLKNLPGAQYLWMLRFISIALMMCLMSLITWKSLRKPFLCVVLALLILDCIPSFPLFLSDGSMTAEERLEADGKAMLYEEAREVTRQRIAFLDGSSTGARGQYLLTGDPDHRVNQTFGAGWQSAATASNIVHLNEAVENGYYDYLFDRTLAMGDDTVLIKRSELPVPDLDSEVKSLTRSAGRSGYRLLDENDSYLLYHRSVDGNFGLVTEYSTIGIGKNVYQTAFTIPDMLEGDSYNLNDYSYEELRGYNAIYLAGFTYDDKAAAQDMIRRLSREGVYVFIFGDGMPADEETKSVDFLGVSVSTIDFENGYPFLYYKGKQVDSALFDPEYSKWRTVYFNGLSNTTGYLTEDNLTLSYLGTGENDHLVYIGLNLSYHYALTHDPAVGAVLADAIGQHSNMLPKRTLIPLTVRYENHGMTIESPEDGVNTTLAYHDIFRVKDHSEKAQISDLESDTKTSDEVSDEASDKTGDEVSDKTSDEASDKSSYDVIMKRNNLLYVNRGTTQISYIYPYFAGGLILEIVAILLTGIFLFFIHRRRCSTIEDNH